MKIQMGAAKTRNGTDVIVDVVDFQSGVRVQKIIIGHLKDLGAGDARGVMVWNQDGTVANCGYPADKRDGMALISNSDS